MKTMVLEDKRETDLTIKSEIFTFLVQNLEELRKFKNESEDNIVEILLKVTEGVYYKKPIYYSGETLNDFLKYIKKEMELLSFFGFFVVEFFREKQSIKNKHTICIFFRPIK